MYADRVGKLLQFIVYNYTLVRLAQYAHVLDGATKGVCDGAIVDWFLAEAKVSQLDVSYRKIQQHQNLFQCFNWQTEPIKPWKDLNQSSIGPFCLWNSASLGWRRDAMLSDLMDCRGEAAVALLANGKLKEVLQAEEVGRYSIWLIVGVFSVSQHSTSANTKKVAKVGLFLLLLCYYSVGWVFSGLDEKCPVCPVRVKDIAEAARLRWLGWGENVSLYVRTVEFVSSGKKQSPKFSPSQPLIGCQLWKITKWSYIRAGQP